MSYMYNGMYGGGMGGMGGMGGGSSSMMSSVALGSVCMSALAAAAFMFMGSDSSSSEEMPMPPPSTETSAPSSSSGGSIGSGSLDGAKAILVGSLQLATEGKCGDKSVSFKLPENAKTTWNIKKAGSDSKGEYYTLQSDFRSFSKICTDNYLTAPLGCKGNEAPYLDRARPGNHSQYWRITGSDSAGYQIASLMCERGRFLNQYLSSSGQKPGKPVFTARGGSSYTVSTPESA